MFDKFRVIIILCWLAIMSVLFNDALAQNPISKAPNPEQPKQKGLTFNRLSYSPDPITGIAHLGCANGGDGVASCNPYKGDMVCTAALPVLCFRDLDAPVPANLANSKHWSGGIIASTSPIAASQFNSVRDVDAFCQAQFGKVWRIASFHDGGGWGLSAYGNIGKSIRHVWVDIKDQKTGTCWTR